MQKNIFFSFSRFFILAIAVLLFCAFLFFWIDKSVTTSGYFNIKKIVIKGRFKIEPPRFILGKNLLSVDLKSIEKKLFFDYPTLEKIKITRSLPDTLVIDIKARVPIAKLRLKKTYLIDNQGAIIELPIDEKTALPEIIGLENKIVNSKNTNKDSLNIALTLLKEYSKIETFKDYPIEAINLSDLSQAYFTFGLNFTNIKDGRAKNGSIKVIIGKENIIKRLKVLSSLLAKIKSNLTNISYIDLRFEDPVTGI